MYCFGVTSLSWETVSVSDVSLPTSIFLTSHASLFLLDRVPLKVNKMTSFQTLLPLDYYHLPFCAPVGGPKMDKANFGERLAGDRIQSSPYYLLMKKDMYCEQLCISNMGRDYQRGTAPNKLIRVIHKNYHNNWIVDGLPAGTKLEDDAHVATRYWQGIPIGFSALDTGKAYIFNHVNIEIMYHKVKGKYRVVRFIVEPFSIKHDYDDSELDIDDESFLPKKAKIMNPIPSCNSDSPRKEHTNYQMETAPNREPQPASGRVLFTYDVIWIETKELKWASRWDIYLSMDHAIPAQVHWVSVINSAIVCIVLLVLIATALVCCFRKERNQYNSLATDEEGAEQGDRRGWTAVRGDVFRPPTFLPMFFAVICGTGAQLLCTTFLVVLLAAFDFLGPPHRGRLLMGALYTFASMGIVAGYVSARLCKTFKVGNWQRATTLTAVGFPGLIFGTFIFINMIERYYQSTKAVTFTLVLMILFLFCMATPLVFLGASFGDKCGPIAFPFGPVDGDHPHPPPRGRPWYWSVVIFLLRVTCFDILPFGAIFVEFYLMMSSAWMGFYYIDFGFLLLVLLIAAATCAFTAIVITYFRLRREDYRWWWSSLTTSGAIGAYIFLYSFFYFQQLEATGFGACCIFFGSMAVVSLGLAAMMGFVGVWSSLWFTKRMYSSLKRDQPNLEENWTELADHNPSSKDDERDWSGLVELSDHIPAPKANE
jgi:transmembrane 9 superfamily protein 2/4